MLRSYLSRCRSNVHTRGVNPALAIGQVSHMGNQTPQQRLEAIGRLMGYASQHVSECDPKNFAHKGWESHFEWQVDLMVTDLRTEFEELYTRAAFERLVDLKQAYNQAVRTGKVVEAKEIVEAMEQLRSVLRKF